MPDTSTFQNRALPRHTFLGIFPSFFARDASKEVRKLYINSAILDLAISMVLFFEPIYLYSQGIKLKGIALFYLMVYMAYLFFIPFGAKFVKKMGIVPSIFIASIFLILYYFSFIFISRSPYILLVSAVLFALQKTFYWPAYHVDFAEFSKEVEEGREVSNGALIGLGVFIIGPVIGGFILQFFGFVALFIVVAFLAILSNFSLILTPEHFKKEEFSYTKTFKRLFSKEHRRRFLAYVGFGEELILLAFWPIFVFLSVKNIAFAGILVSGSTLVTAFVVLYVGKLTDTVKRDSLLRFTTIMYAVSWLLRMFVRVPFGIFLVDAFSRVGKSALSVPLTALTYNHARRGDVAGRVIFFEMSLIVGKIVAAVFLAFLFMLVPEELSWPTIFMAAGLFTLLYTLLKGDEK